MNPRTVTRTFVFVALMLDLGVAGAYAQHPHGHVKMTFWEPTWPRRSICRPIPSPTKCMQPAKVRSDDLPFVNSTPMGPLPSLPPAARGLLSES